MLLILVFALYYHRHLLTRMSALVRVYISFKYFSSVGKLVFFLLNNNVSRVKISLTAV